MTRWVCLLGHVDGGALEPAFRRFRAAVDGGPEIPAAFSAELRWE